MTLRLAQCRCGALKAACEGEPVQISVCHCLACQRRTGSAFAAQARYPTDRVTLAGDAATWVRTADSGRTVAYHFCPACGSTVTYETEITPGLTAVPLGAFADPVFPPPRFSVYEARKHPWVAILGDDIEHDE